MLTLEEKSETYTRSRNATERHKVLWYAWNYNKHGLIQLLKMVMPHHFRRIAYRLAKFLSTISIITKYLRNRYLQV